MSKRVNERFKQQLDESLRHGFVDKLKYQGNIYSPQVLVNNAATGEYVLTEIQSELKKADIFSINVAFITTAGLGMLKTQLADFADRGGKGRILVSPYLDFNEPTTLYELLKLKNVEVRMTPKDANVHSKIYIFEHKQEQTVIVGSSNLTHSAMKLNYEWNVKLTSTANGEFVDRTQRDFDFLWEKSDILTNSLIKDYEKNRKILIERENKVDQINTHYPYPKIQPNKMQAEAVKSIAAIRAQGEKRALVVSATGTGKTYLAAFDVKQSQAERVLFLVHREQILRDAELSFQEVIGFSDDESCIYKSGMDLSDKKYVFATVQSLSRTENLEELAPGFFDYILIDEVHRAAAASYQKIMNYFHPDFYLGITATPERTDGQNIFELFHYNLAYEIRLQEALEEEMLSPFLYYGVSELRKEDGELIDESIDFSQLVTDDRVNHLIEKIRYYEVSSLKTKGLIFCSRNDEAKELSQALNERDFKTVALSGKDSQDVREAKVKKLEDGQLDYILTVDIFNEGIDIPSINQVIMLRNTESSIVFVQQLGRGLRRHPGKDFVTVIDFIGNYKNNYMIPIALYGDQSLNKDNYKRKLGKHDQIKGITTINFEEVAEKRILDSITHAPFAYLTNLKKIYKELKNRIGRTPLLFDYHRNNSLDPNIFFDGRFMHYGEVIDKFEKADYLLEEVEEASILEMLSYELLNGKRPHELLLLKYLLSESSAVSKDQYCLYLEQQGAEHSPELLHSVEDVLTLDFFTSQARKKYQYPLIEIENNTYQLSTAFLKGLQNQQFEELVIDLIKTGLAHTKKYPAGYKVKGLEIGEKYTRKDALRLLLWKSDESSVVYGYRTKHDTTPIFITYHKDDEVSETTKYEDAFINEHLLRWYTRSGLTIESNEVQSIIHSKALENELHLFVKREDTSKSDFYYLGELAYNEGSAKNEKIGVAGEEKPVVTMDLTLKTPMSYTLYQYLVRED